jgi:hypothetical protein
VQIGWPVIACAHVVLARPHQLHRRAALDRLGDADRFQDVIRVRVGPAAEAAAREQHVELDLLGFEPQHAGDRALVYGLELFAVPDFAAVLVEFHHAVKRFHRRMRKVRKVEGSLNFLDRAGLGGVADFFRGRTRARR